ncbi:MAG: hypothetical protein ACK5ML_11775 [Lachnospiraceae bacterium]
MLKQFLVSMEEVVELSKQNVTMVEENFAEEIYNSFLVVCEKDPLLIREFVLGAIFNAGRIQGIREERKEKKQETYINPMITILSAQLRMSEEVLKYATDEEVLQIQGICKNINERSKGE